MGSLSYSVLPGVDVWHHGGAKREGAWKEAKISAGLSLSLEPV